MRYEIQWRYKSGLGGPWQKGDIVELDDELARAIDRDSPGVAKPVKEKTAPTKQDRQVKTAQTRALDRQGDPSDQGAITRADFKAVKDGD